MKVNNKIRRYYHEGHPLFDQPYNITIHYTNWDGGMNVKTYDWHFTDYRKFKRALKFKFRWMFLFF